jgi:hypothetical protein
MRRLISANCAVAQERPESESARHIRVAEGARLRVAGFILKFTLVSRCWGQIWDATQLEPDGAAACQCGPP